MLSVAVCQTWSQWIRAQVDDSREAEPKRRLLTQTELDTLCGRLQRITPATEEYIRHAMSSLQTVTTRMW